MEIELKWIWRKYLCHFVTKVWVLFVIKFDLLLLCNKYVDDVIKTLVLTSTYSLWTARAGADLPDCTQFCYSVRSSKIVEVHWSSFSALCKLCKSPEPAEVQVCFSLENKGRGGKNNLFTSLQPHNHATFLWRCVWKCLSTFRPPFIPHRLLHCVRMVGSGVGLHYWIILTFSSKDRLAGDLLTSDSTNQPPTHARAR